MGGMDTAVMPFYLLFVQEYDYSDINHGAMRCLYRKCRLLFFSEIGRCDLTGDSIAEI
jgi:hypothetical protein